MVHKGHVFFFDNASSHYRDAKIIRDQNILCDYLFTSCSVSCFEEFDRNFSSSLCHSKGGLSFSELAWSIIYTMERVKDKWEVSADFDGS